jgi:hypothetical protein
MPEQRNNYDERQNQRGFCHFDVPDVRPSTAPSAASSVFSSLHAATIPSQSFGATRVSEAATGAPFLLFVTLPAFKDMALDALLIGRIAIVL